MSGWIFLIGLAAMFGVSAVWHYRREQGATRGSGGDVGYSGSGTDATVLASDGSSSHGHHGDCGGFHASGDCGGGGDSGGD